jgi:hypothetical protein
MYSVRRYKRIPLKDFVRVLDCSTQNLVGYMSNISVDGAQIVCAAPVEPNPTFNLSIELPWRMAEHDDFKVHANLVWLSADRLTHCYDVGFQFGALKAQDKRIIYDLIAQYGITMAVDEPFSRVS